MKRFVLVALVAALVAGTAFAKDDNGAVAFGIVYENQASEAYNAKISGLLDLGWNLFGPFYTGVEFQGTYKELSSLSATETESVISSYYITDTAWVSFITTENYTTTYTLSESDLSPRLYLSFDPSEDIQALAFVGVSKMLINYSVTTTNEQTDVVDVSPTETVSETPWSVVGGLRGSYKWFYADYTRYLNLLPDGSLNWNSFSADKWSLGVTFRW